ncbi:unnamed protein product [Alternaria alternata]
MTMSTWGATKTSKKLLVEFFKIRGKIVDDSAELLRTIHPIEIELIEVIRKIREFTLDEIGD